MPDYDTKKVFAKNLSRLLAEVNMTQKELSEIMDVSVSAVSAWCSGDKMPRMDKIEFMEKYFGVSKSELLEERADDHLPPNMVRIRTMRQVPLIGQIACGTPILAEENITDYVDLPGHVRADYALTCKGDSMVNAGIRDGDIVYIRQQCIVDNGQIAAVLVGDEEATLKRFYRVGDTVTLNAENPAFPPLVFVGEEVSQVHIIGLAIAYTHVIE